MVHRRRSRRHDGGSDRRGPGTQRCPLYEKSDRLGGLLNDAGAGPFKEYMRLYLDWDIRHTMDCGAEIHLNTEATLELIGRENPDAVIVATGSSTSSPLPGMDKVLAVRDVDATRGDRQKVVVCGGGITMECALAPDHGGQDVTVIDIIPTEDFCANMPIFNKADLFDQLEKANAQLVGGQKIVPLHR